jgi:hypothetical protein
VRTIDGEHLERLPVHIANPAGDVCGITIPRIHNRVSIRREAGLAGRKLFEISEGNPRLIAFSARASDWRKKVTRDRDCQNHRDEAIKEDSQLREEFAPAKAGW